jgi:hypothetical protein
MNPTGMANKPEQKPLERTERHSYRQWAGSRDKILSPPVEAELFFLTSLFIELTEEAVRFTAELANCVPTFVSVAP